ncbi:acyl-CoA synthetase, putative [Plasmodium malariae]|uniref:Acyl-CoA synthetase, putative n=1 Tax=Plasmodium malariae TaxID=5858 RepID=A0A1A8VP10_PLAMA|nr:acyl-CoA synthetase, putative [Plasmodium malariae]SBS82297.1 ATP-dependent acyl-CoA synthetase, putative [Plasmodium malariae]SBT86478.1 acyl-CoA synthetase, putative [Plasmodium malariae]
MLTYSLLILVVYLVLVVLCYAQNFKGLSYGEVCSKSTKVHESDLYRGRDQGDPSVNCNYTHLFNLLKKNSKTNENKIAVTEFEFGEPKFSLSYDTLFNRVQNFSYSLNKLEGGVPMKHYDEDHNNGNFRLLGIYGANSANWITADLACMLSGVTSLVMHSKFSINEVVEILNESKLSWLCIDLNLVESLLEHKAELPHVKKLIVLDSIPDSSKIEKRVSRVELSKGGASSTVSSAVKNGSKNEASKTSKVEKADNGGKANKPDRNKIEREKAELFEKVKKNGKEMGVDICDFESMTKQNVKDYTIQHEEPEFISTIVYTSGTSGKPKGVMLSNKNLFYTVVPASSVSLFHAFNPNIHFSYLPLSHIYERTVVYIGLFRGMEIRVWSRDLNYFGKDLSVCGANIVVGVPKVFNRLYTTIQTEISNLPPLKRFIVEKILALRQLDNNGNLGKLIESVTKVSKKIRNKINPDLACMFNGGGKISPKIEKELSTLLDIKFYQGYGLTETTGPLFVQNKKDKNFNSIGGPVSSHTQYKVSTWETYSASDSKPKGELLIKSKQLFSGYFLKRELTKDAFTEDSFYKTGDVVQINDNGSITFLDRCKGLVKLSQGEYIETDMLNNLYSDITFINYCVVYGDDSLDGPLAIISIDKELLAKSLSEDNIFKELGITEKQFLETIDDNKINTNVYIDYVKQKMLDVYKKTNLNRYNIINDVYLTVKPWDTSNYLTPTFKLRRFFVFKDYNFFIQKVKDFYKMKLKGKK